MSQSINFAAEIKQHEESGGSLGAVDALPAGTYPLTVKSASVSKDGRAIMPTFKVRAPHPNQGQTVWIGLDAIPVLALGNYAVELGVGDEHYRRSFRVMQ